MSRRAVPDSGVRRAINTKITNDLRAALVSAAVVSGRTLSGEIEARLMASLNAESLMAALPRLIAEGIAADREAQRREVLGRATPFVIGSQHGLAMTNRTLPVNWQARDD